MKRKRKGFTSSVRKGDWAEKKTALKSPESPLRDFEELGEKERRNVKMKTELCKRTSVKLKPLCPLP